MADDSRNLDAAGGAFASTMYKLNRKFFELSAKSNAETICLTGVRPFSEATAMDEYRKGKFGPKAGIFECDYKAPLGVRRFLPNLNETSKRARETKLVAEDFLRKVRKDTEALPAKEKVRACIAQLRPEQVKMINEASVIFWNEDEVAKAVKNYEASVGSKFSCNEESLRKMSEQQKWNDQAGLTFIILGREVGGFCGTLKTADKNAGCDNRLLSESIKFTSDSKLTSPRSKSEKTRK